MKTKLPQLNRPKIAFFTLAIVSVGFLAYPLWNYTKFYLALWSFDCALLDITVDASQIMNTQIEAKLQITNPTDYSGLELTSIMCGLEYIDGEHQVVDVNQPWGHWGYQFVSSNVWTLKVQTFSLKLSVTAYANVTVPLAFIINPFSGSEFDRNNAWPFVDFLRTRPEQTECRLDCRLMLSSFLGSFEVDRYFIYTTKIIYQ